MTDYLTELAQQKVAILGLGMTGLACLRFLIASDIRPTLFDQQPENAAMVHAVNEFGLKINGLGDNLTLLNDHDVLIVSPGIPLAQPVIQTAIAAGCEVYCDVELFARLNKRPVIAITGSNGKTTVTELVTKILCDSGLKALYGGNIGVSVLDLLDQEHDVTVLELSSYQLETTQSLDCAAATVLNVVEDHMNRYNSFDHYAQTKAQVYQQTRLAVVNRQDSYSCAAIGDETTINTISFGLNTPVNNGDFGIHKECLTQMVNEQLVTICPVKHMALQGQHDIANALAAIALVKPFEISNAVVAATLASFSGLPHRCEVLTSTGPEHNQALWVNDSKATNVGATIAALESIAPQVSGKLFLIAGGDGKQADFSPLQPVLAQNVDGLFAIGEDAEQIACLLDELGTVVDDLPTAVVKAYEQSTVGDCVLLSPACASGNEFNNYIERGLRFGQLVQSCIEHESTTQSVQHG